MTDYGPLPEPDSHAALCVAVNRALFDPACQRLSEWALIGPVQRAALESFAERLLAAERERCASICDGIGAGYAGEARRLQGQHATHAAGRRDGAKECSATIRMAYGLSRFKSAAIPPKMQTCGAVPQGA